MARGNWASYIVKQRQFVEHVRTMYGRKARYGKWVTLAKTMDHEKAARIRAERSLAGLQQTVVMQRGKIVIDATGFNRKHVPYRP